MPVNDYDLLLARADKVLQRWKEGGSDPAPSRFDLIFLLGDLAAALRATLAARPQPLFEGPAFEFCQSDTYPTTRVVVYPAPAGSETPTDEQLADGYPLAVAGSATPTDPKWGYEVPDFRSFSVSSGDVAGSATPTGDNHE